MGSMDQKRNYQVELEKELKKLQQEDRIPTLLLHSCCAPCSSYVLEYLAEYFDITVFYYNPNITEEEEYRKRAEEQKRLITAMPLAHPAKFLEGSYEPELFFRMAKGLEKAPEGGDRCAACYRLRLMKTAGECKARGFDYFTTTLTISPLKNAQKLNAIGNELAENLDIAYLPSDFKKKNGYKRSVELSGEYHLYRQNYCGCIFSKQEQEEKKKTGGL